MVSLQKVFFVYVDYTNDGRPFYVGKGNRERIRRKERNAHWRSIAAKHGWSIDNRRVVLATLDETFAYEQEVRLIVEHRTFEGAGENCWGANRTRGGDSNFSGYRWTAEQRARVTGVRNHCYGKRGELSHNYGRKHSPEVCARNSVVRSGEQNQWFGKYGEDHPASHLTWDIVYDIRRRWEANPFSQTTRNSDELLAAGGCTAKSLAAEYGVHVMNIYHIIRGRTWKITSA